MFKFAITGMTPVPIAAITQQYMAVSAKPITMGPEKTFPELSCHGSDPMNFAWYGNRTRIEFLPTCSTTSP
jgi:hypothetical protein